MANDNTNKNNNLYIFFEQGNVIWAKFDLKYTTQDKDSL